MKKKLFKIPPQPMAPMLGVERYQPATTAPTCKSPKVCAQQSMSDHLPAGSKFCQFGKTPTASFFAEGRFLVLCSPFPYGTLDQLIIIQTRQLFYYGYPCVLSAAYSDSFLYITLLFYAGFHLFSVHYLSALCWFYLITFN